MKSLSAIDQIIVSEIKTKKVWAAPMLHCLQKMDITLDPGDGSDGGSPANNSTLTS